MPSTIYTSKQTFILFLQIVFFSNGFKWVQYNDIVVGQNVLMLMENGDHDHHDDDDYDCQLKSKKKNAIITHRRQSFQCFLFSMKVFVFSYLKYIHHFFYTSKNVNQKKVVQYQTKNKKKTFRWVRLTETKQQQKKR